MTTSYSYLVLKQEGATALITINRPAKLNALNAEVLRELDAGLSEIAASDDIRAVVITGAGERAFVAGVDVAEMAPFRASEAQAFSADLHRLFGRLIALPKPVIAAVRGYALGGGCELALACDFIYAAEDARFGLPEISLGIIPGAGGTQLLSRRIGVARAKEMILTGDPIDAHEALRLGLVNRVLPASDLLLTALATAEKIASRSAAVAPLAKEAIQNGAGMDLPAALDYEATLFGLAFATEDHKEGLLAFLEKRTPTFRHC